MFSERAKELGFSHYWGTVKYYDRQKHIGELNLLSKPNEFRYQNEFRLIVENPNKEPLKINIGDISSFTEIYPIENLKKMRFQTTQLTVQLLKDRFPLKNTGRSELDETKNSIVNQYIHWCLKINSSIYNEELNNEGMQILNRLREFRLRVGTDQMEELNESNIGWKKYFDEIDKHINQMKSNA